MDSRLRGKTVSEIAREVASRFGGEIPAYEEYLYGRLIEYIDEIGSNHVSFPAIKDVVKY